MTDPNDDEVYTVDEVTRRCRMGRSYVEAAISSGRLAAIDTRRDPAHNHRYRVTPSALRSWIADGMPAEPLPAPKPTGRKRAA